MFDIGWSEMAIIMLVALVVIGPKDLPRLARSIGQWVAKGRAMAREFQRSLEDMAREAELDDVKREIEKVGRTNITKSLEKTIDPTGDLGRAFDPKAPAKPPPATSVNGEAKEPAAAPELTTQTEPATTSEPAKKPKPAAKAEAAAKPETTAKAKPTSRRKSSTPSKTTAKPRKSAQPKATTGSAPKPAPSDTTDAETMAEPR